MRIRGTGTTKRVRCEQTESREKGKTIEMATDDGRGDKYC